MLKTIPIRNFLLLKYRRPGLIQPPAYKFNKCEADFYLDCQDFLFYRTVEQIRYFHPNSHIHVLTNEILPEESDITYHVLKETWTNHICKFKLYSLIDEPAMYIDLDVVFLRPLPPIDYSNLPFWYYNISHLQKLQTHSGKNLNLAKDVVYNSGVTWINKPSPEITNQLMELHEEFFSDRELIFKKNGWPDNDEHACSLFVIKNDYSMPLNDNINVTRNSFNIFKRKFNKEEIKSIQSIHYSGVKTKQDLFEDYHMFEISKFHGDKVKSFFKLH